MCEILVKAVDAVHINSDKDKAGSYKVDDAVVVMPDGHGWGKEELNTKKFYILKIPDMTLKDGLEYIKPESMDMLVSDGIRNVMLRRRKYKIDSDSFFQQNKDDIENKGNTTMTKAIFTSYITAKSPIL